MCGYEMTLTPAKIMINISNPEYHIIDTFEVDIREIYEILHDALNNSDWSHSRVKNIVKCVESFKAEIEALNDEAYRAKKEFEMREYNDKGNS